MKIRLTGTRQECDRFTTELVAATAPGIIRDVSGFHPNHHTPTSSSSSSSSSSDGGAVGRVYLDLQIPDTTTSAPEPTARRQRRSRRARAGVAGRADVV